MSEKTIGEICNVEPLEDKDYALVKWHNKVVKMTASEITIADISRMLRQKIFLEIAIDKAIMTLKNNPFAGELYTGELLSSLLETDRDILENKKADIAEIIRIAEKNWNDVAWGYPEEKDEFKELVIRLKEAG